MVDIQEVISLNQEMRELHDRQDIDRDLYYLKKYLMLDDEGKPVEGIINVTLNLPATFAAHVISSLSNADEHVKVTSDEMDDLDRLELERLIDAAYVAADARLLDHDEAALRPFLTEQLTVRGAAAARVMFRREEGPIIADIVPIDTRYFVHDPGRLAAYTTWRMPGDINDEYNLTGRKAISGVTPRTVTDAWDSTENGVYVGGTDGTIGGPNGTMGGTKIFDQENTFGEPPFVFRRVPLGSMLKDKNALRHHGESIFFLIRDLIPELNRLASILQTLNLKAVNPAHTFASSGGTQATPPANATDPSAMTSVELSGGIAIVPLGDVKAAGRLMQTILSRMIEQGSLSTTAFGSGQQQLSAVAIVKLGEGSGQVFVPRLGAKGLLMQGITEMFIRQMMKMGGPIEFGAPGHMKSFDPKLLKGEYGIEYFYHVKSPETDAALLAMADAARVFLDDETIAEKILHLENPDEVRRRRRIEASIRNSPALTIYHDVTALLDEGRELEAEILADSFELALEDVAAGDINPPEPTPTPGNDLPVFANTVAGSNTQARRLQGEADIDTPEEEP